MGRPGMGLPVWEISGTDSGLERSGEMMRKLVVACATLVLLGSSASAELVTFSSTINGAQANDCAGTGSGGSGSAVMTLDTVTLEASYYIEMSGLTGNERFTHVHGPAPECVTGEPIYPLPLGSPKIGTQILTAAQAQDMLDGLHYINVHTTFDEAGEIRGQILRVPGNVPTSSEWGMAAMALLTLTAGTIVIRRQNPYTA